jgi:hypothetical protein
VGQSHCRQIAERLGARHDVRLTSTARDYVRWREGDTPGWTTAGPVRVCRFPVASQRSLRHFAEVSDRAFSRRSTEAEQREWFEENGPRVPALVEYLRAHGRDYDVVLFWAFRYYQTYFGVPVVATAPSSSRRPRTTRSSGSRFSASTSSCLAGMCSSPRRSARSWRRVPAAGLRRRWLWEPDSSRGGRQRPPRSAAWTCLPASCSTWAVWT